MRAPLVGLIVSLGVLALSLGAYVFWHNTVSSLSDHVDELVASAAEKNAALARLASGKDALVALASDEETLKSFSVAREGVVSFLESIESRSAKLGAHLEVGSVVVEEEGPHPLLLLTIKITGSFEAVLRALGLLEYGPHYLETRNAALEVNDPKDKKSGWILPALIAVGTE